VAAVAATLSKIKGQTEVHAVILDGGKCAATPVPSHNEWMAALGGVGDTVTSGVTHIATDKANAGSGLTRSAS